MGWFPHEGDIACGLCSPLPHNRCAVGLPGSRHKQVRRDRRGRDGRNGERSSIRTILLGHVAILLLCGCWLNREIPASLLYPHAWPVPSGIEPAAVHTCICCRSPYKDPWGLRPLMWPCTDECILLGRRWSMPHPDVKDCQPVGHICSFHAASKPCHSQLCVDLVQPHGLHAIITTRSVDQPPLSALYVLECQRCGRGCHGQH